MKHLLFGFGLVFAAAMSRLIPHPPNFTPIAAMALSCGVYLDKRYAFIVPLAAMLISDYFIGFHEGMWLVYGSFLLIGLIGLWLKSHKRVHLIVAGTLLSSILFFVITNFGVWAFGTMYTKTFAGLTECYVAAIPFFRNTLLGDFLYVGVIFGLFELLERYLRATEKTQAIETK